MRRACIAKFIVGMIAMTFVSAIAWEKVTADVYDCSDGKSGVDYLTPGFWVHDWGGPPIQKVVHVTHNRSMSEPDTIDRRTVGPLWPVRAVVLLFRWFAVGQRAYCASDVAISGAC